MKGKIKDLEHNIEMYVGAFFSHNQRQVPLSNMMPVYRMMRNDIINQYCLEKGEFTKYYAYKRGRNNI